MRSTPLRPRARRHRTTRTDGHVAPGPPDLHDRLTELAWRERSAIATRTIELPIGFAVVTDDLPMVYDQNMVWVRDADDAESVVTTVEQLAADAGWRHRNIEISDLALAGRLRDGLVAAGYAESRHVSLALGGDVVVPDPGDAAVMSSVAEQRALGRALLAEEPWATSDDILDQFGERERRLASFAQVHAVVAPATEPVSRCLVLLADGFAEIDAVVTLSAHRGSGWSTAVMGRAIAFARAQQPDAVVVVADAEDWPVQWYRRLGFTDAGVGCQFRRWPKD